MSGMTQPQRLWITFGLVLATIASGAFLLFISGNVNVSAPNEVIFRFAIGSDSHYGSDIPADPPDGNASSVTNFVNWMNEEKRSSRLDAVFLNGDITMNPRTGWKGPGLNYPIDQGGYVESHYVNLKANHLDKLEMPIFLNKGNHDYVDPDSGGAFHTWEGITKPFYEQQAYTPYIVTWGEKNFKTGNHVVEDKEGRYAWVMADTSVYGESEQYDSIDVEWLARELERLQDKQAVFVLSHIAQRLQGWPKFGVDSKPVMDLIESAKNVKAIFHGHNHDELGRFISGGKPYFFVSHISSWGNKKGYRVVEIFADGSIQTYQFNAEDNIVMNTHDIEPLEDRSH